MAMSFLVPTSAFFRCSRLQLTTAAGYWITEAVKVFIAVTLFLRELGFQYPPHSVSVLKGGFAGYLFVILAKIMQDSKVIVAFVYVIYLPLWLANPSALHFVSVDNEPEPLCQTKCYAIVGTEHLSEMCQ